MTTQNRSSRLVVGRTDRTHAAFTLIELLVVVAIIAVLVAMLLPALTSAREIARQTVCLSSLRNINQALLFYADESGDGKLAPGVYNEGHPTMMTTWDRTIQKYLSCVVAAIPTASTGVDTTRDVFACPSDQRQRPFGRVRSYSMLYYDDAYNPIDPMRYEYRVGVPLSKFPTPANDFVLAEWQLENNIRLNNGGGCVINPYYYMPWWTAGDQCPALSNYHRSGNDFLFADGHAALMNSGDAAPDGTLKLHWQWQGLR